MQQQNLQLREILAKYESPGPEAATTYGLPEYSLPYDAYSNSRIMARLGGYGGVLASEATPAVPYVPEADGQPPVNAYPAEFAQYLRQSQPYQPYEDSRYQNIPNPSYVPALDDRR